MEIIQIKKIITEKNYRYYIDIDGDISRRLIHNNDSKIENASIEGLIFDEEKAYFIDWDGFIQCVPLGSETFYPFENEKLGPCEKVDMSGIIRDDGFIYFLNIDGNIARTIGPSLKKGDEKVYGYKFKLKKSIKDLLLKKAEKTTASDINASLKYQNLDEIKELCEEMYHNSEINRTANYRYYTLNEEIKKPSIDNSEKIDIEEELEKLKSLLDKGLINQEAYEAKMNQILDL